MTQTQTANARSAHALREVNDRKPMPQDDLVKMLLSSLTVDKAQAKRLREQAGKRIAQLVQDATQKERQDLAKRLAAILPKVTRSPDAVVDVLGKPAKVSRQILFRRYVEQWVYEQPLPLVVRIDHHRGEEAAVLSIEVLNR